MEKDIDKGNIFKKRQMEIKNRIIKFRFWDRFEKKMYEVYNLKGDSATGVLCSLDLGIIKKPCRIENGSLMQYTGIDDCKGKEIYEGDIVKGSLPEIIQWEEMDNTNYGQGDSSSSKYMGFEFAQWGDKVDMNKIEIIGNIYENTELIQKNKWK